MVLVDVTYFYASIGLGVLSFVLLAVLFLIKRNTNALQEWKAKRKGWPLCHFWSEDRIHDCKAIEPKAGGGIIVSKKWGMFILTQGSSYLDKNSKVVHVNLDTTTAYSVPVKMSHDLEVLVERLGDPKELEEVRNLLEEGDTKTLKDFEALRTPVKFGFIKGILSALTPHRLQDLVSLEVQRRIGNKALNWNNIMMILGLLGGMALVAMVLVAYLNGQGGFSGQTVATPAIIGNVVNGTIRV